MTRPLTLDSFLEADAAPDPGPLPDFGFPTLPIPTNADDAAANLERAYGLGHQAGWLARDQALAESNSAIASEIAETLQAQMFSVEEARDHVLAALSPLLRAMVQQVLPRTAHDSWGAILIHELQSAAEGLTHVPVSVQVAPGTRHLLAPLLANPANANVRLTEAPELGALQASFCLGGEEYLLDLDGVLSGIEARVSAFLSNNEKGTSHG